MELSFSPSSSLRIQAIFPHCKRPFYHTKIPTKPTSKSHRSLSLSLLECYPMSPSIALCGHRSCSKPASNRRYRRNSIWVCFISLTNHIEFVHLFFLVDYLCFIRNRSIWWLKIERQSLRFVETCCFSSGLV
jgi:hypothetical protein